MRSGSDVLFIIFACGKVQIFYDNEKVFPHFHQSVAPPVRPCYADAPVKMRGTRQGEMREGDSSAAAQLSEQEDMRTARKADKPLKNAGMGVDVCGAHFFTIRGGRCG